MPVFGHLGLNYYYPGTLVKDIIKMKTIVEANIVDNNNFLLSKDRNSLRILYLKEITFVKLKNRMGWTNFKKRNIKIKALKETSSNDLP